MKHDKNFTFTFTDNTQSSESLAETNIFPEETSASALTLNLKNHISYLYKLDTFKSQCVHSVKKL